MPSFPVAFVTGAMLALGVTQWQSRRRAAVA